VFMWRGPADARQAVHRTRRCPACRFALVQHDRRAINIITKPGDKRFRSSWVPATTTPCARRRH
jgi:hypothetical protein